MAEQVTVVAPDGRELTVSLKAARAIYVPKGFRLVGDSGGVGRAGTPAATHPEPVKGRKAAKAAAINVGDEPAQTERVAPAPLSAPEPAEAASAPEGLAEPPRAGKGSGRDVWAAYASTLGITVDDDVTRDDIIDRLTRDGLIG